MTITVIFGAGASYDSDRQRPASLWHGEARPPLATDLFLRNSVTGPILDSLPVLQGAATRLNGLEGAGVEDELGRLQEEAVIDPLRARQLVAARVYLRRSLRQVTTAWAADCHGMTSYAWLNDILHGVRQAAGLDLCYLTFNYDRLLDEALERLYGVRFAQLTDYVDVIEGVELHKLHGALDWVWPRPDLGDWATPGGEWDREATELLLASAPVLGAGDGHPILLVDDAYRIEQRERAHTTGWTSSAPWLEPHVPALAIPVRHKYSLVLPDELVDRMKRRLEATTRLIIVGWRAQEDQVLGILREHMHSNQATLIVDRDGKAAAERGGTLRRAGIQVGHVVLSERGFSELRAEEVTSFVTMAVD